MTDGFWIKKKSSLHTFIQKPSVMGVLMSQ